MLLFLHVPKTAGTTLRKMLIDVYGEPAVFLAYRYFTLEEVAEAFNAQPEVSRQSTSLVSGHFSFGLHSLIPGRHRYITMIREPIDRVASTYYFIRRMRTHDYYPIIRDHNMSLVDFMRSGIALEADNGLTRRIAGPTADYAYGKCPDDMLEIAKANLRDHFDVVGLSEQFNASVVLAARVLGWERIPLYVKANVTKERKAVSDLSTEELHVITEHCRLDLALYEYAKQLIAEETAAAVPDFNEQLTEYERALDNLNDVIDTERARAYKNELPFARLLGRK